MNDGKLIFPAWMIFNFEKSGVSSSFTARGFLFFVVLGFFVVVAAVSLF